MPRIEERNREIQAIDASDEDDAVKIDQVATVRGWFRPRNDEDPVHATIQGYINEQLTLEEVSAKLFTPIDEKINAQKLDDVNFGYMWNSIIQFARRTDFRNEDRHERIRALVNAFKTHSNIGNEKYNYLYEAMTDFGMCCREAYNYMPIPRVSFDIEVTAWTNMNFFYASLTGKQIWDLSQYYAIWAMRQALEYDYHDDEEATAVQKYDAYVPAAAVWALGAFRVLFQAEKDLTPTDDRQGDPARGGELWTGKSELSNERWNFWKERFAVVGDMDGVQERTRDLARDAVNAMERAATFELIGQTSTASW